MMIDTSTQVLILLAQGGEMSVCVADITKTGDRYIAFPRVISPAFSSFRSLELTEDSLELIPSISGGRPVYYRKGVVVLDDQAP
jgi:hypothetical protein